MRWVAALLILLWVYDTFRLRGRLRRLKVLPGPGPDEAPAGGDPVVLAVPGCEVPEPVRLGARAHMAAEGLEVVDLVPADLGVEDLLGFLQLTDPVVQHDDPFIGGRTAGAAFAVDPEVARRAEAGAPANQVEAIRLGARLKHFAARTTGHALAPGLRAPKDDRRLRQAVIRESTGPVAPFVLALQGILLGLLALSIVFAPVYGLLALAVLHLEPVVVVAGTGARPRDLWRSVLLRGPLSVWRFLDTLAAPARVDAEDPVTARRPVYASLLEGGTDRFFEPRRQACPLCGGTDLGLELEAPDLFQYKPGRFRLERCRGCDLVFQNPRLTLEGLDFYYRDFYDGLGAGSLDGIFGFSAPLYEQRGDLVATACPSPRRWLDVGTGHGHLPLAMKARWPETRFEGLDMTDAVDEAEARRWIDKAHRGLFPDLAPDLAGSYDVVSMSHYLEHTRDPEAEVAAAATVLEDGGHLLIEVPDPECDMGRRLGRYWLPYFQPQHQHLLPPKVLGGLLEKHGFEVLTWHRGEAHQAVDFTGASIMWLGQVAPGARRPWRPQRVGQGLWRTVVWGCLFWLVPAAMLTDKLLDPGRRTAGRSNTYRVLARKA